ncbi:hypothetical protein [Rubinisphaera italica]|uniref:Uncharacterized protein n=1 Tax=Rubinisphaera italica TaxID=2527969 RepID=A0A5C5XCS0_9PLAN|nr:hypothetical protein [Rubinisphaera italica]TWT60957.1 hypothetical protein Pan54_16890 [Rubinisphaera italica]
MAVASANCDLLNPAMVLEQVRGIRLILYEPTECVAVGVRRSVVVLSLSHSQRAAVAIPNTKGIPNMSQSPIWRRSLGLVSVAVFAHRKDADSPVNHTISCNRRYYDGNEKSWKTSQYLGPTEIGAAVTLLKAAEAHLVGIQSDEGGDQS